MFCSILTKFTCAVRRDRFARSPFPLVCVSLPPASLTRPRPPGVSSPRLGAVVPTGAVDRPSLHNSKAVSVARLLLSGAGWGAGVVICLVPAHPGSPGKRAVKWLCVCLLLRGCDQQRHFHDSTGGLFVTEIPFFHMCLLISFQ